MCWFASKPFDLSSPTSDSVSSSCELALHLHPLLFTLENFLTEGVSRWSMVSFHRNYGMSQLEPECANFTHLPARLRCTQKLITVWWNHKCQGDSRWVRLPPSSPDFPTTVLFLAAIFNGLFNHHQQQWGALRNILSFPKQKFLTWAGNKYLNFLREKHFKCLGSIFELGSLLKHIPIIVIVNSDFTNETLEGKMTKYS